MTKRIALFIAVVIAVFFMSYFGHQFVINNNQIAHSYSLFSVYLFHIIASIIIYVLLELVAEHLPTNAGYAYLALTFIKMGFFVLIFQKVVFGETSLSQPERISLVVPLFLFLTLEAVFAGKLLNSK